MHIELNGAPNIIKIYIKINSPIKDSCFLEDVSQIDVGIEEIRIEGHRLFEMMYCQPYFILWIEDAPQITPGYGEVGPSLDGFKITSLKHKMNASKNWITKHEIITHFEQNRCNLKINKNSLNKLINHH